MTNISEGKGIILAGTLLKLTEYVGDILKQDNKFYKQKNKQLLKQLLQNNTALLLQYQKVQELLFQSDETKKVYEDLYQKETGEALEYDKNIVLEDFDLIENIFRLFLRNYLTANDTDLISMFVALNSIKNKEKLLTEKELGIFSKKLLAFFVNYEVDDNKIKTFIQEYGKHN